MSWGSRNAAPQKEFENTLAKTREQRRNFRGIEAKNGHIGIIRKGQLTF